MLCEAATPADLPPIYKILANIKKKDAAIAISHALDERAREGDSTRVSPVVTPELIEPIYAFKAGAPDVDDLTAGFSLFLLFITGSPEATTQARDHTAVIYSLLHGGHVAPSLLGSNPGDRFRGPADGTHSHLLGTRLSGLQHLPDGCVYGLHHRSALHFREFVDSFRVLKMEIEEEFGSELHTPVLPLFQRHTQLTMARHFNDVTTRGALAPLPEDMDLVDIIKYRRWSQLPPPLPLRYTMRLSLGPGGLARGTNYQPTGRPIPAPAPANDTATSERVQKTSPPTMSS
jgi:hypothetical protein